MSSLNRVFLMGHLTRDPDVRQTGSGTSVCDLNLAITDRYRNKKGEAVEESCFVGVVAWGGQADACGKYLSKGSPILVEGALQLDQWETEAGDKRSRLLVRAGRVEFLSRAGGGGNGSRPTAPSGQERRRQAPDRQREEAVAF